MSNLYLSLVHNPVYNKNFKEITTTVTNLDLHDIARASRTYNLNKYYIVNHLDSQQELVARMREYWASDFGAEYNPDRQEAFSILDVKSNVGEVIQDIEEEVGIEPVVVTTDARKYDNTISYQDLRDRIHNQDEPYLVLLGTGWGLTKEVMESADYILEPVYGRGEYNHLSVRSAASIILDRLVGETWWD
ncbi:RNA methyltransferase [Candidatus Frackibacter sp. WG13]|uniref:RNA methyltransferase n=1 Tax=Candidatus Frackibacter sp. WG13 TaxID=2017978 RepID=UPI000B802F76